MVIERKKTPHGRLPDELKICPVCGKKGLEEYMPFRPGMEYKCKFCGYIGPLKLIKTTKPILKGVRKHVEVG